MNTIKPLQIIGKRFDDLKNQFVHAGIEEIYEDLREGEEQEYAVSAIDGTWEMLLDKENRIKTIFLFLDKGCQGILNITSEMNRSDIINLLGTPTRSGDESNLPILGQFRAWERYDQESYCIHIEHNLGGNGVRQMTVMLLDVTP